MHVRALKALAIIILATPAASLLAVGEKPVLWWSFDGKTAGAVTDSAGDTTDAIAGNFRYLPGPAGSALKPDGYTTCIERKASKAPALDASFTVKAWIAHGAYPWNWCPVIAQQDAEKKGYRFAVGPNGDFALELAVGGKWHKCASEKNVLPLRQWVHIAATYDQARGITLYANGKQAGRLDVKGKPDWARQANMRALMNYDKAKPSNIHRPFGTLPQWFSIDGLVDEIKLYNAALKPEQIKQDSTPNRKPPSPALPLRVMPAGPAGPGRFGAYYCNLKYYEEWDNLWQVAEHPDIVVRFDQSATRIVFWRGSRFSPAWVSENGLWMADQSIEAWNDTEGCYEHMQDRHCHYSHVRIVESNAARAVVHWRYAPTSSHDHHWRVDPKTGWGCWVDEYYYFYPDATGIRKVTWKTGTLGQPRQFQESLPFTQPGQVQGDVVETEFATVANLAGETGAMCFVENPPAAPIENMPADAVIQRYNFRSRAKPFILFEVGNKMEFGRQRNIDRLDKPGTCNHWPVCQMRSDGRDSQATDRPAHFLSHPISYAPIHQANGRNWWHGLYGMTDRPMEHLVRVAKAWNFPAKLELAAGAFAGGDYDMSQRAYVLTRSGAGDAPLKCSLAGSEDNPIFNPVLVVKGWGDADVTVTINGQDARRGEDFRAGICQGLDRTDLVVYLPMETNEPVEFTLTPRGI